MSWGLWVWHALQADKLTLSEVCERLHLELLYKHGRRSSRADAAYRNQ